MVKSIARSLIAGIALMALAERADAIEPSIADIQRALAFDEVMLRARAGQLEDEWRGSVGPATARQWRDYLDRLPPGLAGAFAAWWQARGRAQLQSGAWQSGLPGPQASKSNAERLAAIEISIEANYPGGLRAFDAELIRCYGDGDIRWLVLCSPSILNADRDLALLAAERRDLLQLVGKFPPSP